MRKCLSSKGLPFKDFFDTGKCPWPPRTSWVQHWNGLFAPKHVSNSASRSETFEIRIFKAHYAWYSMERIIRAMEENPDRISWTSEMITPLNYNHRKSCGNHQTPNSKFLLEKTLSGCWHDFTGFTTELIKEILKETVDMAKKKKRWGVKSFKIRILEKWKANRYHTRGINGRQLDGDEGFWTSARGWGRRCRRSSTRKQTDFRHCGRRVLIIQHCFWLLLQQNPFCDMGTETKAHVEKKYWLLYRNIF